MYFALGRYTSRDRSTLAKSFAQTDNDNRN